SPSGAGKASVPAWAAGRTMKLSIAATSASPGTLDDRVRIRANGRVLSTSMVPSILPPAFPTIQVLRKPDHRHHVHAAEALPAPSAAPGSGRIRGKPPKG